MVTRVIVADQGRQECYLTIPLDEYIVEWHRCIQQAADMRLYQSEFRHEQNEALITYSFTQRRLAADAGLLDSQGYDIVPLPHDTFNGRLFI